MLRFLKIFSLSCILLFAPVIGSYAAAGCCSHHGGSISGSCDKSNHQVCKDGSSSPTCLCGGGTSAKTKGKTDAKTSTMQKMWQKVVGTSKSKKSEKATTVKSEKAAKKAQKAKATTPVKTTGCCARHGGVDKCNKKTGYQKCKDGTMSATCKC